MKKEQWKPVVGYEGYYEVSNCGRVRSLDREIKHGIGEKIRSITGRVLSPTPHPNGYKLVSLCLDGVQSKRTIHRLVLEAFVGPCPDGMECLHGDDIPYNNFLSNLRWGTKEENRADALINGGGTVGQSNGMAKLNEQQVHEIHWAYSFGFLQREIAEFFGVDKRTISSVLTGRTWSHI